MRPPAIVWLGLLAALAFLTMLPSASAAGARPSGVIVVALGNDSTGAAEALARAVYRDPSLRPAIDEATARTLAGEPPPEGAPARIREIAELRRAIGPDAADVASRRLLASLGRELGALLVVAVALPPTVEGASAPPTPLARVIRPEDATIASVQLAAVVETAPDGSGRTRWPDAVAALRALAPAPGPAGAVTPAAGPRAPSAAGRAGSDQGNGTKKSVWSSGWFWAGLGALVTVGVTVFVIGNAAQDSVDSVRLEGKIAP